MPIMKLLVVALATLRCLVRRAGELRVVGQGDLQMTRRSYFSYDSKGPCAVGGSESVETREGGFSQQ